MKLLPAFLSSGGDSRSCRQKSYKIKLSKEALLLTLGLLNYFAITIANGQAVYEEIANVARRDPEISDFFSKLAVSQVFSFFTNLEKTGTIFAPTNEAVRRFLLRNPGFTFTDKEFTYFVALTLIDENDLPSIVATPRRGNFKFYLKKALDSTEDWHFYLDEVLVFRKHLYHNGGTKWNIFVINEIPQCVAIGFDEIPLADQLSKPQRQSQKLAHLDTQFFNSALTKLAMHSILQQNVPSTFFIVEGRSATFAKYQIPRVFNQDVARGHVIPEHVLFTPGFHNLTYLSEQRTDNLSITISLHNETDSGGNSMLYVKSRIASPQSRSPRGVVMSRITMANVGVLNGVVHFIDRPIGAIVDSIYDYINHERDGRFRDFFRLLDQSREFVHLLRATSGHKTIFVPTNEALSVIPQDSWDHIKANSSILLRVLKHHLITSHSITQEDVRQSEGSSMTREAASGETVILREVQCKKKSCTFALVPKFIVESGGINATVQSPDIAATDGIIHVIDRVLGVASHDLWDKIKKDANLETTVRVAQKNQWYHKYLENVQRRYTFFAPSEQAWSNLRARIPSEYKQLVEMDDFFLQAERVLTRHVLPYELTLQELSKTDQVQPIASEDGDRIFVSYVNGKTKLQWNGVTAEITQSDLQGTNGIIHIIDNVLMHRDDMTISAAFSAVSTTRVLGVFFSLLITVHHLIS